MAVLIKADNQPINARYGDSAWLTSFITPDNPDVQLKYLELTEGIPDIDEKIEALWRYVAHFKYQPTIASSLSTPGRKIHQKDTWFYPAEAMQVRSLNCANKAFLLTSLVKNALRAKGQVYCALGRLNDPGMGNHAWVQAYMHGRPYILESTISDQVRGIVPSSALDIYEEEVLFDEEAVYTMGNVDTAGLINAGFEVNAISFLQDYICEKCLALE